MTNKSGTYRAAYESHHVAYVEEFDDYESAAKLLFRQSADVHNWPVGIYQPGADRLWLWCGYRTLGLSRESALEDARAILGLARGHQFAAVAIMAEDL